MGSGYGDGDDDDDGGGDDDGSDDDNGRGNKTVLFRLSTVMIHVMIKKMTKKLKRVGGCGPQLVGMVDVK